MTDEAPVQMSTIGKRDSSHDSGGAFANIRDAYNEHQQRNLRKSPDGKSDSTGSFHAGGNNVPWGHASDKRKLSSKMFSMTAKIEGRPATAKYATEGQELSPPKYIN